MYAVTLLKNSTKEVIKLLGFVNSKEEFEDIVDQICSKYGTEYIASHDLGFGLELAF